MHPLLSFESMATITTPIRRVTLAPCSTTTMCVLTPPFSLPPQDALYAFYESVPVGGFVIFDDIRSHPAVALAWADFCLDQGITEVLQVVDDKDPHAQWFRKQQAVPINQAKKRPPQDVNA